MMETVLTTQPVRCLLDSMQLGRFRPLVMMMMMMMTVMVVAVVLMVTTPNI